MARSPMEHTAEGLSNLDGDLLAQLAVLERKLDRQFPWLMALELATLGAALALLGVVVGLR